VVGSAGLAAGVVAGWDEAGDGVEDNGGSQRIGKTDGVEEPRRLPWGFWEPVRLPAGPADRLPAAPPLLAERRLPAGAPCLPPPIFPANASRFAAAVDWADPPAPAPFPLDNPEPVPTAWAESVEESARPFAPVPALPGCCTPADAIAVPIGHPRVSAPRIDGGSIETIWELPDQRSSRGRSSGIGLYTRFGRDRRGLRAIELVRCRDAG